ncbi:MIP/aquaporin family protein [Chitinimonas sp. BJYL2]|uniref:MIP/aquaporin family protein n=1 Tax=Chitinimonas sp. BJYL2 TaxID=2976696 RepID=UPI0027E5BD17|nr:MIP/aquaporin family protein [Chitinimonas sp. BJYL2]
MSYSLSRRLVAEALGTAFLLACVVGSGIMAERLSGGNTALALLANAIATGGGLIALILAFGGISGAHFNPAVSLSLWWRRELEGRELLLYVGAQVIGAFAGVIAAHAMFGEPAVFASQHARTGISQWWSEFVATFGLLAVIFGTAQQRPAAVPYAVAGYIVAAYWFTASTSFANPAVTLARAASDTFAGIRPIDAPLFIIAQLAGAMAATMVFGWLVKPEAAAAQPQAEAQRRSA